MIYLDKQSYRKKSKEEIIDELFEKIIENEKLKRELCKYKNPNTPPSAYPHLKPKTFSFAQPRKKRGARKNHKGTTRKQVSDRKEIVDATHCPNCNCTNLKDKKIIKRTTEDTFEPIIPENSKKDKTPKKIETVKSEIHMKKCLNCGLTFIPSQNTTPLKGKFGINLMTFVIFIKFVLRGVLRKTSSFLDIGFGFRITPASINAIIKRVADASEKEYEELKIKIRNSIKVYVDETSFSVLGKNWWVWVFRTENEMLLAIRSSRGSNVLREILGEEFKGTVICDCWKAYDFLGNLQRCWAHLLRKSKIFCDTVAGRHLHERLEVLFKEIKSFNKTNPTSKQRLKKYTKMTARLKKLTSYYSKHKHLRKAIVYIDGHLEDWFTCIKTEGIEPTNNFAEQSIRETVVVRKIIGAFRSIGGVQNYEKLASLLSTWQIQKLDIKTQLKKMLIRNLCFC